MKPKIRLKRTAAQARRLSKTRDDFLRWLSEKDTGKKPAVPDQISKTDQAISQALMVWADDGGAPGNSNAGEY